MLKTPKRCELFPSDIIPFLKSRGLLLASAQDVSQPSKEGAKLGALRTDSRKVEAGDIFLAYRGVASDGHLFIQTAIERGAAFVIVEDRDLLGPLGDKAKIPWAQVPNGRAAWAELASFAFGHPQNNLQMLGVTGTNGKTSTVWMTAEILGHMGIPCLTIGTLGARLGDEEFATGHTTPDPDVLFGLLHLAKERGVKVVAMEVSSHSLLQEKVRCLTFSACAFTSFSRDHLDFHPTMDAYWDAKWRLFSVHAAKGAPCFFADVLADRLDLHALSNPTLIYGFNADKVGEQLKAHQCLELLASPSQGLATQLTMRNGVQQWTTTTDFFAKHTLENLTAAALLASVVVGQLPPPEILAKVRPVPGRLEPVKNPQGPVVIVDYAHTPDALEKTLQVLRPVCSGRLCVVFGCGGDRDPGKRPLMGRVAADYADQVFVTSDNPRSENSNTIIQGILAGISRTEDVFVYPDREQAIHQAIRQASDRDVVLIAGKGHETYQIIGSKTHSFDDRVVARQALSMRENDPC